MTRRPRRTADPLEAEVESALKPGVFISYGACFSFVRRLGEVAATIAAVVKREPSRAIALYETFLAGCYEKAGEVDDSGGDLGMFAGDLFRGWITARQAGKADSAETARRLLAWMDDDPWGFCHKLEREAVKVMDKMGLAALEKQIRARFDTASMTETSLDDSSRRRSEYIYRRWGEALRAVYLAQKNVAAYVALAEEAGLTPEDCLAIARLQGSRRKPREALAWCERGIDLDTTMPPRSTACYELATLKRELLNRLDRRDEALEDAWADYCKRPSKYTYQELMKFVPKAERSNWRERALGAARGSDLPSLIDLFVEAKETGGLADLVRSTNDEAIEQVSHYVTERAAKKLEKSHPFLAARLWRAQGMRIVNAKKSKYYDAALSNFERARHCYEKAAQTAEWEKTVSEVRARHHRKWGFISGFENVVNGSALRHEPRFLERAKARWRKQL
jgi:hypothetical protein